MELTVASYNIRHGRGMNLKVSLSRIAEVIRGEKLQVVGLNEVDNAFSRRSDFCHQVQWLSKELQMYHYFAPAIHKRRGDKREAQYGNALLSAYPIRTATTHSLSSTNVFVENRSILEAEILLNTTEVVVFVTHFSLNKQMHKKQTKLLLEKTVDYKKPIIIMGDWNCPSRSRKLRTVRSTFKDVSAKPIATVPSFFPLCQLDYIFVSDAFSCLAAYASSYDSFASDHLALVAKLALGSTLKA